MIRSLFVALTLLLNQLLIAGEGKISGRVVSNQKEGLPFVTVSLGEDKGTYTDNKGFFSIDNLEYGTYRVIISSIGYEKKIIENVIITEENISADLGTLELKENAIRIPEVTVFSTSTVFNDKYQSSNSVVSKADLKQTQPIGAEEALKTQAGINISGDMGISNRLNVGIRGSYPRRSGKLLLLEDGTPIAPAPYLAPEAYYNPPTDRLDGIEIIKGSDILSYGPNTMYGVINYITKRPPVKPALGINITGGENGYQSQFITYGGTWDNTGAELQVLNKHFGGFQENSASDIFNATAKIHADLGKRSSAYMKINYHQENSKATYSGLTPFTFRIDPKQNPFDADDLLTKRYAVDIVYNYKIKENFTSSSKVYGSQFTRDWWRQNNTIKNASDIGKLLPDEIFSEKFSYLESQYLTKNDYVRVGSLSEKYIVNASNDTIDVIKRESTTARNRLFRVAGGQETLKLKLALGKVSSTSELGIRAHTEQFFNEELKNDSSRFARSGRIVKDEKYLLDAGSAYLKNEFKAGKLAITPALRFELIEMYKFDMLTLSSDPKNDGSKYYGSQRNSFYQLIPGISINYHILDSADRLLSVFGGAYRGYTPPTSEAGFFVIEDDVVNTKAAKDIEPNMVPEISNNVEGGVRGYIFTNGLNGQLTYFNHSIENYYAPGRQEAFQTLGTVNISGVETGLSINLKDLMNDPAAELRGINKANAQKNKCAVELRGINPKNRIKSENHNVKINAAYTYMHSAITGGKLTDSDLLSAKHTDATKAEIITKINSERNAYSIYISGTGGKDSLVAGEITSADFSKIKKVEMVFGENGIKNKKVPYVPEGILNLGLTYYFKGFTVGANYNFVGAQYTDYLNLENETAEGAIGKLASFRTVDVNAAYEFSSKNRFIQGLTIFVAGKNILNDVYKASRLHRVASGIMPAGFRQINGGIRLNF